MENLKKWNWSRVTVWCTKISTSTFTMKKLGTNKTPSSNSTNEIGDRTHARNKRRCRKDFPNHCTNIKQKRFFQLWHVVVSTDNKIMNNVVIRYLKNENTFNKWTNRKQREKTKNVQKGRVGIKSEPRDRAKLWNVKLKMRFLSNKS